jgi:signal transduction histidine kinase
MKTASNANAGARAGRFLDGGRLPLALLALSLLVLAALAYAVIRGLDGVCVTSDDAAVFLFLTIISAAGLAAAFFLRGRRFLRLVLAVEYAFCLAFILYFPVSSLSWLFLIITAASPISLYLQFPRNILWASAAIAAALLLRFVILPPESVGQWEASFRDILLFLIAPFSAAVLISFLSALTNETARISDALLKVTKLNLSYQDYTANIEEKSAHEERLRLARDIHDVVGYALTNTMMLMRAASLMIREEPEKVPGLIENAQRGAESALAQVRGFLRDMRRREIRSAAGPNAIAKVVRVFRTATGADVDLDFGNFDWAIGADEAFAVYHFVQEAMLNAFSHGKATAIRVSFRQSDDGMAVTVRDNGSGAKNVTEGIGISGMRERLAKLGGGLEYSSTSEGFSITMRLPPPVQEAAG